MQITGKNFKSVGPKDSVSLIKIAVGQRRINDSRQFFKLVSNLCYDYENIWFKNILVNF